MCFVREDRTSHVLRHLLRLNRNGLIFPAIATQWSNNWQSCQTENENIFSTMIISLVSGPLFSIHSHLCNTRLSLLVSTLDSTDPKIISRFLYIFLHWPRVKCEEHTVSLGEIVRKINMSRVEYMTIQENYIKKFDYGLRKKKYMK